MCDELVSFLHHHFKKQNWDDLVKIVSSSPRFEFYFFNSHSFPWTKEKKIPTELPQEDRD